MCRGTHINIEVVGIIIQAFAAVGTFCAVIVALWQTKYANRKKMRLSFSEKTLLIADLLPPNYFSTLKVVNIGNKPITIVNWGMVLEKESHILVIQSQNDRLLSQVSATLPRKVEPEEYITLAIRAETMFEELKKAFDEKKINKKDRIIVFVADSTGKQYRIKSKRNVGHMLNQLGQNAD